MPIKKIAILFSFFILFYPLTGKSLVLSNVGEISILTCSPGNEAYSVYGHSAIRVKDDLYHYDIVFNYGIFDFSTPNFTYRFASGQTDYLLGAYKFNSFYEDYFAAERSIYEQVLNITQTEKQKIFDFLLWNAKPENRVYRYNFFFDNCASRIRDVVVENIDGQVQFPEKPETEKTFRQLIKDYHSKLIWLNFGIDLVVSAPADKIASVSEEMFLPDYLMKYFAEATIKTAQNSKPLVINTQVIYQAPGTKIKSRKITSPVVVFGMLFFAVLYFSFRQFHKNKMTAWLDNLVYGFTGLIGFVMLWFVLFSEHPAMHPNYNLLWAVPANLIFVVIFKVKKWQSKVKYYHILITVWLVSFLLLQFFLPQKFHPVHYLLIGMVLSRSVFQSLIILKKGD